MTTTESGAEGRKGEGSLPLLVRLWESDAAKADALAASVETNYGSKDSVVLRYRAVARAYRQCAANLRGNARNFEANADQQGAGGA